MLRKEKKKSERKKKRNKGKSGVKKDLDVFKLPENLDFEEVGKLLDKVKVLRKGGVVVDAKDIKRIDIVGLQFILSLLKSGFRVSGFEKIREKLGFEVELKGLNTNTQRS